MTILFAALCMAESFAINNDSIDAVTMSSYEQSWLDDEATISLTNNTTETIHNVDFIISYFDMKGSQLDYEEFVYEIEIVPGMTKSLDIPAYNHERRYHYYKTADDFGHPSFKVNYELKGFNLPEDDIEDDTEYEEYYGITIFGGIILLLIMLGAWVGLYVLVAVLAKRRGRNVAVWVLLSLFATPLLITIILLCIGDKQYEDE